MTTTTSSKIYSNLSSGDLSFTNIVANETDVFSGAGFVQSLLTYSSEPVATTSGADIGISWNGVTMSDGSDGTATDTQTVTVTYDIAATGTNYITSIDSFYNVDIDEGGATFTAVESVSDGQGNVVGTQTFSNTMATPPPATTLTYGVQNAVVTLTLTESASTANSYVSASVLSQLFGETPASALAALGDYVWLDANKDGLQTSGETGVAGVTVDLLNAAGTSVLGVTTTNATGYYHFTGLIPGTYDVKFVAPLGEQFTTTSVGANTNIDSNANQTTGLSAPVTLTAGQTDNSIDAGLVIPGQATPAITIDKQISADGTNWVDVNDGVLTGTTGGYSNDPAVFVGSTIYERVIVSNTGSVALTNVSVSDINLSGTGPLGTFSVGTSLAIGQTVTSAVSSFVASAAGYQEDQATVTGIGNSQTVTASDQANYTTEAPAITIDKQISADGTNWVDVNDGVLTGTTGGYSNDPAVFVGSTIYERVVVSNTGSVALTSVSVSDINLSGTGPLGTFSVGTSLAIGQTVTSAVSSFVASAAGYQEDQAAVTGTGTDSVGHTQTVTASDQANYTTEAPAITLDKQISTDGTNWADVTDGVISGTTNGIANDPTVAAGATVYERVIVVNTGSVALTNVSVTDANVSGTGPLGTFSVGTSLAVGQTVVSNVSTFAAASGYQEDKATVVGTGTDSVGHTQTVTANDVANYTGPTVAATCALGDYVWLDCNDNGLQDSGETGVAGVTVDLLNAAGTSVLAVTTTNSSGIYHFTDLAPGTYDVQFVAPQGDAFTLTSVGTNRAIDSNANQTTGLTAPVTLTAGQTDNTIDAGLTQTSSISINKVPGSMVVNSCGQETYTFDVTNTGGTPITNVVVKDNIGTASNPDYITPTASLVNGYNVGDSNKNGVLDPGETWQYTVTTTPIEDTAACNGKVSYTCSGSNLGSGNTAWFSCSFKPTSTANGACYVFQGVTCNLSGSGSGNTSFQCPDSVVKFSSSCSTPTTTWDSQTNCWTTTLPANCSPGNVFLTGCPVQVPSGCNFNGCTATFSISNSGNNCGSSSVTWNASCQGYSSFNNNGQNGCSDFNQIGVKVCDNGTGYGNGGCLNSGYGWSGSGYNCSSGWGGWNSGGYQGGSNDCAGTPENQYTSSSCGGSGWGYGGWGGGGGGCNTTGCGTGGSGSCTQSQIGATGVADTVTVTGCAETMCCATVSHTCSGGNLGSGNTAWFNCTFKPTSTANGTCYTFKGVTCDLTGSGVGSGGYTVNCPDATVTFSSSCTTPTTTYNSQTNCWQTTLPANCNPGNVFLTGCPVTVPSGCNFSNANGTWSIGSSSNNCGSSSVTWNASCAGYSSFNQNGTSGCSDYNQIGVKVCDSSGGYGNGGNLNSGYGYCDGSYSSSGNNGGWGGWGNWWGNSCSYQGSSSDCAGTPENQYTSGNCGSTTNSGCGSSSSGSCTQTQMCSTTVTASDTAEVMVLGSNSNVTVGGNEPTGSLSSLFGKAQTLEFTYSASADTVSTKTSGIGTSTVGSSGAMAFIVITNNSNPTASGAQTYFEGTVASGQKLYADASINALTNTANTGAAAFFSTVAGASIYADIFTSQAAFLAGAKPVQVDSYNTSGSQAMYAGDQIGGLTVVGYLGATGGHLVS